MQTEVAAREQNLKNIMSQCTRLKNLAMIEEMRLRAAKEKSKHVFTSIIEYQATLEAENGHSLEVCLSPIAIDGLH